MKMNCGAHKVLHGKYGRGSTSMMHTVAKNGDSTLWKALVNLQHYIHVHSF
jgi:hypothetical protein